tara:strand:+ start:1426 stop:1641 length:216 start_codon:yes stop_codon:yes gene_type:complete
MTINPIPIKAVLKINTKETIKQIFIYNLNGALTTTVEKNFTEIDISKLAPGIYTIMIKTNSGIVNSKFIKE